MVDLRLAASRQTVRERHKLIADMALIRVSKEPQRHTHMCGDNDAHLLDEMRLERGCWSRISAHVEFWILPGGRVDPDPLH